MRRFFHWRAFSKFIKVRRQASLNVVSARILAVVCIAGCANVTPIVQAESIVYYAGVSYLGDSALIKNNYPVAYELNLTEKNKALLDVSFYQHLVSKKLPFKLIKDKLGDYEKGPAIAMSLAIELESTSIETTPKYHKLIAEVSAQILFFDFQSMRLLASIPVEIARNAVLELSDNIEEAKQANTQQLFLNTPSETTLLTLATDKLLDFKMPGEESIRVKVDNVDISEKATPFMPESLSPTAYAQIVGQYFTAQLAHFGKLNMIPYTNGYALKNKMSLRMSNNEVFQLTLPDPDYVVSLELSNFKAIVKENRNLYASRMLISAREATDSQPLFKDYFHFAVAKLVSANMENIDDWSGYQDSIETLLGEISMQVSKPKKKWFENHSQRKRANFKAFKQWSKDLNVY